MKLIEIITDRTNKLSPYKFSFLIGAISMIFTVIKISLDTGKMAEIPQTWVYFLTVLGGSQLTSTFLKNKEVRIDSPINNTNNISTTNLNK